MPHRRVRPGRLLRVQRALAARSIRLVEVETKEPSPFAKSLLFGYVGAFVYEGDVPLAEKKAAALSLDASLLAELLGKDGLKQLLDAGSSPVPRPTCRASATERQADDHRAAVRPIAHRRAVHPRGVAATRTSPSLRPRTLDAR